MKYVLLKSTVSIDGKRAALPGDVSLNIERVEEEIDTLEFVHKVSNYIYTRASGSITFRAPFDPTANDPIDILDAFGFRGGFYQFNPTTEVTSFYDGRYDMQQEPDGELSYGVPIIPIEKRQLEETAALAVSQAGTYKKIALKFKAGADSLKLLRFLARNAVGDDTDNIDLEIWDDLAGEPNAQLAGSNTLVVNFAAGADAGLDVYTGAALATGAAYTDATWQTVSFETINILGTASLVPGEDYWFVFTGKVGEDAVYFNYTTSENFNNTDVMAYTATWAANGMANMCFVIQEVSTVGGHSIIIENWDLSELHGVMFKLLSAKVRIAQPSIQAQKSVAVSVTFDSKNVEGPISL